MMSRGFRADGSRLWFTWKDDGRDVYFLPDFGVWPGQYSYSTPFVAGKVRPLRPPLLPRLASGLRELAKPPTADKRLAEIVARARDEILAADRFLSEAVAGPGVHLMRGSIAEWREALQDPDLSTG